MIPEKWHRLYLCNPMAITIELFRNMFFGGNTLSTENIATCWVITLAITLGGVLLFNRVEKTFMDTV